MASRHPYLRRWDQQVTGDALADGTLPIAEGTWIHLEDGVEVWFVEGGKYRTGDYWMVAARTLTGDVEWPRDEEGQPLLEPPHGPKIH